MTSTNIGYVLGASVALMAILSLEGCGPAGKAGSDVAQLPPAQACLRATDAAQGLDACKSAIATDQNNAAFRRRMGLLRLKSHALSAARQSYQIAISLSPNYDAEAEFGLGLTLEAIGEPKANLRKLEAVEHDPAVIDRFRKYGISDLDLMTFDTAPQVVGGQSPEKDKAMVPKQPLPQGLTVDVRCQAGLTGKLHDCAVISPIRPDQAVFGEAAKTILATTRVKPARNKGAPIADAPIVLTYVFWPQS
jgi:tetratricopeptide (TPR) repeat protein